MTNFYQEVEKFIKQETGGSRHLERTVFWLKKLCPEADEALLISAISHDAERIYRAKDYDKVSGQAKGYQSAEHLSYHQETGAKIMAEFLQTKGAGKELIARVVHLISKHEVGGDDEQNLLKDADSLSFLENNIDIFLSEQIKKMGKAKVLTKFTWMFERITSPIAKDLARPYFEDAIRRLNNQ